jgi:hypothetical protein
VSNGARRWAQSIMSDSYDQRRNFGMRKNRADHRRPLLAAQSIEEALKLSLLDFVTPSNFSLGLRERGLQYLAAFTT